MRTVVVYLLMLSTQSLAQTPNPPFAGFVKVGPRSEFESRYQDIVVRSKCQSLKGEYQKALENRDVAAGAVEAKKATPQKARDAEKRLELVLLKMQVCTKNAELENPLKISIDLHREPNSKTEKVGTLDILDGDGSNEAQYYRLMYSPLKGESKSFFADINYQDNVKDDLHTALEIKGGWVKLPRDPFPFEVWANFAGNPYVGNPKIVPLSGAFELDTETVKGPVEIQSIENGVAYGHTIEIPECDCPGSEAYDYDEEGTIIGVNADYVAPPKEPSTFESQTFKIPVKDLLKPNKHFNGKKANFPECNCC